MQILLEAPEEELAQRCMKAGQEIQQARELAAADGVPATSSAASHYNTADQARRLASYTELRAQDESDLEYLVRLVVDSVATLVRPERYSMVYHRKHRTKKVEKRQQSPKLQSAKRPEDFRFFRMAQQHHHESVFDSLTTLKLQWGKVPKTLYNKEGLLA